MNNGGQGPRRFTAAEKGKQPYKFTRLPFQPNIPNIGPLLATSAVKYFGPLAGQVLGQIREASEAQIRSECTAYTTHAWKSLASQAGADLENYGFVHSNLFIPYDVNGAGITLGRGRDNPKLAAGEPGAGGLDDLTLAFMEYGGDFYTVNIKIPQAILNKPKYAISKGVNTQVDYLRVRDGVYELAEGKSGRGHYEMEDKEENQLLKSSETIQGWHKLAEKPLPVIKRYYMCVLADDARNYYATHRSEEVYFLSKKGMSRFLNVPTEQFNEPHRRKFTEQVTAQAAQIADVACRHLGANPATNVSGLRKITPAQLGIRNTVGNLARNQAYIKRRTLVFQQLPVCAFLDAQLESAVNKGEKKDIATQLLTRLGWLIRISKGPKGTTEVLDRGWRHRLTGRWNELNREYANGKLKMLYFADNLEASDVVSFIQFCKARREYLDAVGVTPRAPPKFTEEEAIEPKEFNAADNYAINLLKTGKRNKGGNVPPVNRVLVVRGIINRANSGLSERGRKTVAAMIVEMQRGRPVAMNLPENLCATEVTGASCEPKPARGAARPVPVRRAAVAAARLLRNALSGRMGIPVSVQPSAAKGRTGKAASAKGRTGKAASAKGLTGKAASAAVKGSRTSARRAGAMPTPAEAAANLAAADPAAVATALRMAEENDQVKYWEALEREVNRANSGNNQPSPKRRRTGNSPQESSM